MEPHRKGSVVPSRQSGREREADRDELVACLDMQRQKNIVWILQRIYRDCNNIAKLSMYLVMQVILVIMAIMQSYARESMLSLSFCLSGLTSVPTMGDTFAKATRKTA